MSDQLPSGRRYRAIPFSAYSVSRDVVMLYAPEWGTVQKIDGGTAYLLRLCREGRTLDEHAEFIVNGLRINDRIAIRQKLEGLVERNLLRDCQEISIRKPATTARSQSRIDTLAILTADRPAAFRRCLESYVDHCREHSRDVRVLVLD